MSILKKSFKILVAIYLISSYKTLPFAYFLRFYNQVIKLLVIPKIRLKLGMKPKLGPTFKTEEEKKFGVFKPLLWKTYNSPFEVDMFFHKSNSTYFEELDIVRTYGMSTIFQKFLVEYSSHIGTFPYLAVSGVQCNFRKEIKPYEKYNVTSRVFCWDEKTLYFLSKFTLPGQKNRTACTSLAKYVFKDGRKTIKPIDVIKASGLFHPEIEKISAENYKLVSTFNDDGTTLDINLDLPAAVAI